MKAENYSCMDKSASNEKFTAQSNCDVALSIFDIEILKLQCTHRGPPLLSRCRQTLYSCP
jgi:hypothetical protein